MRSSKINFKTFLYKSKQVICLKYIIKYLDIINCKYYKKILSNNNNELPELNIKSFYNKVM